MSKFKIIWDSLSWIPSQVLISSQDHRVVSYRCRMFLGHWVTDLDKTDLDLTQRKTEFEIFSENSSTHTALIWTLCFTWLRLLETARQVKNKLLAEKSAIEAEKAQLNASWLTVEMYVWNLTQRLKGAKGFHILKTSQDNVVSEVGMFVCFQCFYVL